MIHRDLLVTLGVGARHGRQFEAIQRALAREWLPDIPRAARRNHSSLRSPTPNHKRAARPATRPDVRSGWRRDDP